MIRKKTKKKVHVHKKQAPETLKLIIGIFTVFLLVIGFFFVFKQQASSCANSISCIHDLSGKYDGNAKIGTFRGKSVKVPQISINFDLDKKYKDVLADSTNPGEKIVYVDLTTQHLYAFQGSALIFSFLVSTGKWYPTPTGTFYTWIKLPATRMTGGNKALGDFYDLPNVPWTMYFYNDQVAKSRGFSLHGAYWHNNFGHPMSHGCVNIRPDQAEELYAWADPQSDMTTVTYATPEHPGIKVVIYGTTPAN